MERYIRDRKTGALFLKDESAIQKRNADIRMEERIQRMETEIHNLREMISQMINNQQKRV